MSRLRVGLVGIGVAGKEHLKGWASAGAEVLAVADPDPEKNREAQEHSRSFRTYRSLQDLIAKEALDVIDICTPHHLHALQISQLAQWPGTLFVEKPLATNPSQLDDVMDVLRKRKSPIIMRTNKRFERHTKRLMSILRERYPWDNVSLSILWRQRPQYMASRPWYRLREISQGGVVLGMGIHYFDLLAESLPQILTDRVSLHTSRSLPNAADTTVENFARIQISAGENLHIDLTLSCWEDGQDLPFEQIQGTVNSAPFSEMRSRSESFASLRDEFEYYTALVSRGVTHPALPVIMRSHDLAFQCYALSDERVCHSICTEGKVR